MNKQELQQLIISTIYDNTTEDISGNDLQGVLLQINNKLSEGDGFGGIVRHDSILTPDQQTFYIAGDTGYYPSFNVTVSDTNTLYFIEYNQAQGWHLLETPFGTYSKPAGGIPDTDLTSTVRKTLEDADTIAQNYLKSGEEAGTGSIDFDPFADTVHNIPQTLSSSQKQQARQNIDAQVSITELPVSDGSSLEIGSVYVDSSTGNVKVKLL